MNGFDESRVRRDPSGRFAARAGGAPAAHLAPTPRHGYDRMVRAGAMDEPTLAMVRSWVVAGTGTTPQGNHVAVERDAHGWTHLEVTDPDGWEWDDDVPVSVSLDEHGTVRCVVWRQCPPEEMVQCTNGTSDGQYAAPVRSAGPALITFDADGEPYEQVFTNPGTGAVTCATRRGRPLDPAGRVGGDLASPYRAVMRARTALCQADGGPDLTGEQG